MAEAVSRGSTRTGVSGSTVDLDVMVRGGARRPGRGRPRRSRTDGSIAARSAPRRRRCAPSRGCSRTGGPGARTLRGSGRFARATCPASRPGACRLLAATRIAVSGVRRSCASEASSAVFRSSPRLGHFGRLAVVEQRRALDGNRHHRGQRVERARLDRTAGRGHQANRPGAHPQRHQPDDVIADGHACGGRSRSVRARRTRGHPARRQTPATAGWGRARWPADRLRPGPTRSPRGRAMAT